ncbi:MAG: hypothetical protein R3C05_08630 [Pirellulaceae bacterium]
MEGVPLLPLVAMRGFISDLVDNLGDAVNERFDSLAERLNVNPRSRLALAIDETLAIAMLEGDNTRQFTGALIRETLLDGPDALFADRFELPVPVADRRGGDGGGCASPFGTLGGGRGRNHPRTACFNC